MSYDGIIFDFDGVLLDSASDDFEWAAEVRREKAKDLGYEYNGGARSFLFNSNSFEDLKRLVEKNGFSWEDYLEIEKAVAERKVEMVKNGEMNLFPSAKKVVKEIKRPLSVVSNAYGEAVDRIVREKELHRHLEFWTAPRLAEIERYHSIWKPETYMLDRAMEEMRSSEPVMIGDSWFDVKAAKNAGIDSVLIERANSDIDLEPDYRISNLEELKEIVS